MGSLRVQVPIFRPKSGLGISTPRPAEPRIFARHLASQEMTSLVHAIGAARARLALGGRRRAGFEPMGRVDVAKSILGPILLVHWGCGLLTHGQMC